jgi:hypothetical protein
MSAMPRRDQIRHRREMTRCSNIESIRRDAAASAEAAGLFSRSNATDEERDVRVRAPWAKYRRARFGREFDEPIALPNRSDACHDLGGAANAF